jgi:hypothetical protein
MARYTQHYMVEIPQEKLLLALSESLKSCNLTVTYSTGDYVMAQEMVGSVSYAQLVTVEILIHQTEIEGDTIKLTCVSKNQELPLRANNHCHRMASLVSEAFASSQSWKLLEMIPG